MRGEGRLSRPGDCGEEGEEWDKIIKKGRDEKGREKEKVAVGSRPLSELEMRFWSLDGRSALGVTPSWVGV